MSNKIAIATIQFRADAKGANAALDSLRASADDARRTMKEMQDALDHGVKKLRDVNGVEFNVEDKLKAATKEAKQFDQAVRELVKGATALETVVDNIRLGEIEKSSRAELKGAINAANSRLRSIREKDEKGQLNQEDLQMQRDLNTVIAESQKQLNRLDRDTQKVIETLKNGGTVAESVLKKEQEGLEKILSLIPKGTDEYKQYADQLKIIKTYVADIRQKEQEAATSLLGEKNLGKYSEEQIRAAIDAGRQLIQTYKTASPEAQALADNIVRAEQHLKNYGVEAARAAAKEAQQIKTQEDAEKQLQVTMNKRLRSLSTLSAEALAETKKYWEAQVAGAELGSAELAKYEANLKKVTNQEEKRRVAQLDSILTQPGQYGVAEVKNAVQEMEKLRDSVKQGTAAWLHYNKMVEQGKAYLDNLAKTEAMQKIETQMQNLNTLSASGLQEVKKYWEAMVAGAAHGSTELTDYETKLKEVTAEEERRARIQAEQRIGILGGNLSQYSEKQIREAIEAGNLLIKTYKTGSDEARKLGQDIVAAETHLKQYGTEAARTAQREADALKKAADQRAEMNQAMVSQLYDIGNLTPEILKQQEQYWQKMVNDPKSAGQSLQFYKDMLQQVKQLQDAMIQNKGQAALNFFRGDTSDASANDIKKQAEALKKYRDSLPQASNAALIQEIDGYLAKTGKTAEKATEEMMGLSQAMGMSANAGKTAFGIPAEEMASLDALRESKRLEEEFLSTQTKGSDIFKTVKGRVNELNDSLKRLPFSGTTEDLKKAQQAIEQAMAATDKGTPKYERLRMALSRIKAEMAGAGISAQKTQEVLANPKAEKSVEVLKAAVTRARAELDVMGQRAERLKRLIEQAGSSKETKHHLKDLQKQLKDTEKDMEKLAKSTKDADFAQKQLANTSKGAASAFDKAWSRLKTYITLYVGAAVAIQKLTAAMGDLMELSDKMGEVRKTTGFTADEVGRLSDSLKKLDVRTPLAQLMEISAKAGQLGLKTEEDVRGFTEAANKLMIALPEMGTEAATEMMKIAIATGEVDKIRKQMQEGIIEGSSATAVALEKVGSTIDQLRANSAAAAPAITDFVKRVGAVGAQSGITIDQVAALGSTVDALGMRVEMSATALSRMIPAIKNNAFAVAKAIGVTPEELRNLFETGRGMEAILMIFQHIKDAGMDADSIEKMLGMGGMKEVMKELNQQGARAGIVFAGLSQNVDELRRQLGVAAKAYEENIAIQNEYNKMNDTTAAKWERLKNYVEELFVGDSMQRFFGFIIDGLRYIIELLTGPLKWALALTVGYVSALKLGLGEAFFKHIIMGLVNVAKALVNIDTTMTTVRKNWIASWKAMDKASKANWIGAIISALVALGFVLYDVLTETDELQDELNRLEDETDAAVRHVNNLVTAFKDATNKADAAGKKHEELKKQTESLRKEVDELKKSNSLSAQATETLNKKEEELKKAEEKLRKAADESNKANNERLGLIAEINSKYGTYLGYMLNEKTAAEQVASAHQLIIAALKEEMKQKGLARRQDAIDSKHNEKLVEFAEDSQDKLSALPREVQQRIKDQFRRVLTHVSYDAKTDKYTLSAVDGLSSGVSGVSQEDLTNAIRGAFEKIIKQEAADQNGEIWYTNIGGKGMYSLKDYMMKVWDARGQDDFSDWAKEYVERERELSQARHDVEVEAGEAHKITIKEAFNDINTNASAIGKMLTDNKEFTDEQIRQLAQNVNAIVADLNKYGGEIENVEKYVGRDKEGNINDVTLDNAVKTLFEGIDEKNRKRILHVARKATNNANGTSGLTDTGNPWGEPLSAESTDWKNMTAEQLVNRRKQMKDFVNAIQTDTDVQSVLKEDAALKKAIEAGMSADMRTVIEWYNDERLKIQDELHARHLTNTGDWLDPKKQRARKKQLESEYRFYLQELDAYYTERKAKIQEEGNEEGVTEQQTQRRITDNEVQWQQRRMELMRMYRDEREKVTDEEAQAIFKILAERTDDTEEMVDKEIKQTVKFANAIKEQGHNGEVEFKNYMSKLDIMISQSLMKQKNVVAKQLKAIHDVIMQERPFDGIAENMQKNLGTMGILVREMEEANRKAAAAGEDEIYSAEDIAIEEMRRTSWLLGQAEDAYKMTAEELLNLMSTAWNGEWKAWADSIRGDRELEKALLAMLHQTYDKVQDAIKKESSLIKKQVDISWNDMVPGSDKSTKQTYEAAISRLGLSEDQVKRANSLISAGIASERVADKLAIKQMQIRLAMQEHYYNLIKKKGNERINMLRHEVELAREEGDLEKARNLSLDLEHAKKALNLSLSEEQLKTDEQRVAIANRLEESQNRLYQNLKEWGDLLASSIKDIYEAENTGNAEYYNELAKYRLTGKGGPGAGTYVVIDNAGTEDAEAHYEYLSEREALERQHEIEVENARAEAWRKMWDSLNEKMSEQITDWMNAAMQNQAIDANTNAVLQNTEAIAGLTSSMQGNAAAGLGNIATEAALIGTPEGTVVTTNPAEQAITPDQVTEWTDALSTEPWRVWEEAGINAARNVQQAQKNANQQMQQGTQSTFAKMTSAANLYGIAYQTMSNDNLDAEQKWEMFALQAAGQAAIAMLTTDMLKADAKNNVILPGLLGKFLGEMPYPAAMATYAIVTAMLGGLMGMAMSKVAKSKSQISQVTGASSASAGKLTTGMLQYAEGNVNEFTDPGTLTPGRQYNVDAADGKTYRARYTGRNPKTHLTKGPEFHLVGEKGQEAVIDARTTRQIRMNDTGIWHDIQTLYNGGSLASVSRRRRGRGVAAFADGNLDDFEPMAGSGGGQGFTPEMALQMQASLDRNSAVIERALEEGFKGIFDVYGKDGLVDSYDTAKKVLNSHGERY